MTKEVKAPLSESSIARETIRALVVEEGIDCLLMVGRLICDIEARGAHERRDERASDLWRARARLLANVTTMARRVEGRES
jgi:hypothetical protein